MGSNYFCAFMIINVLFGVINGGKESLQCRDENGDSVDWYVLYKLPKVSESSDPVIRKGLKYLYITDKTASEGWRLSKEEISSVRSTPGRTLDPLYTTSEASKAMWIMYSDQAPKSSGNSRFGHAKGIVMTDENNGFWLIHSVPNYPPIPTSGTDRKRRQKKISRSLPRREDSDNDVDDPPDGEYGYPTSGTHYGQSFLCISVNANEMNDIGVQLVYNQITSYRFNLPRVLSTQFPSLVNASKRVRIDNPPYNQRREFPSIGGRTFISFAKSDKWQQDLYDDFVAPKLQSDLLTETWLNGPGKLPSECNGAKVLNVESIVIEVANIDFKSSRDHSKWAVATNNKKNKNWVCIGDINRAKTQFDRGGGTVCINSLELWKSYRKSVNEVEACPKNPGIIQKFGNWICSYICVGGSSSE